MSRRGVPIRKATLLNSWLRSEQVLGRRGLLFSGLAPSATQLSILTWYLFAPFFRGFWQLLPDTGSLDFGLVFSAVDPDKNNKVNKREMRPPLAINWTSTQYLP